MLERLQAESRAAQVLVTAVNFDEKLQRNLTTIKFVEEDSTGQTLQSLCAGRTSNAYSTAIDRSTQLTRISH